MRNGTMVLVAILALVLAAPAVAQDSYADLRCRFDGIGCLDLATRNAQNVVPNAIANYYRDRVNIAQTHWPGQPSAAYGMLAAYQREGYPGAFDVVTPHGAYSSLTSYGPSPYGYGAGYGGVGFGGPGHVGTPPFNGHAGFPGYGGNAGFPGFSPQLGLPMYNNQWGVGWYGGFGDYGPGFLDYNRGSWSYHTRGRRHSLATQDTVNAWGIAGLLVNGGHFIHDIIRANKASNRDKEIQASLEQLSAVMVAQQQLLAQNQAMFYQRAMAMPQSTVQTAPVVQQAPAAPARTGVQVVNPTNCNILIQEKNGTVTLAPAQGTTTISSADGIQYDVVEAGTYNVTGTVANGGAVLVLGLGR